MTVTQAVVASRSIFQLGLTGFADGLDRKYVRGDEPTMTLGFWPEHLENAIAISGEIEDCG